MKHTTQFLIMAGIGAITGNGIARHTPIRRPICLRHDAIPIIVGTAIPTIISIAVPIQPTILRLLGASIAGAGIAYLMPPNDPVAEDKKTNNNKKEDNMKITRPTETPTEQEASKNPPLPSIRLKTLKTPNSTNSSPAKSDNPSETFQTATQKKQMPPNTNPASATADNQNPTEQVTAQAIPVTTQSTNRPQVTPQNNTDSSITNPETAENTTVKYVAEQAVHFFSNLFAPKKQKSNEEKPTLLTAKQKRLQKIEERQTERKKRQKSKKLDTKKQHTKNMVCQLQNIRKNVP